eukprot:m.181086 g.181086  ORF g.181086 m.181086 type:complete len:498 (+) comp32051_c0_seq3:164-1657(+)
MTNAMMAVAAGLLLTALAVGVTFNVSASYHSKLQIENRQLKIRISALKQTEEQELPGLTAKSTGDSDADLMRRNEELEDQIVILKDGLKTVTAKMSEHQASLKQARATSATSSDVGGGENFGLDQDATKKDKNHWNDPLDGHKYAAHTTGFPTQAMVVDDAEMCDPKKQALLSPAWLWCPTDPTCRKCAAHWDRNTEVVAAFKNEDSRKARAKLFQDLFANVTYNTVVVQAVNFGQIHLWLNWVCSCDANGIKARDFTIMVPSDPAAAKVIQDAGFKTIGMEWMDVLKTKIGTVYGGKTNAISTGHSDINNALMMTGQELLHEGFNCLLLDVDFVWMKDPRHFLMEASRGRDILAMLAPRWDAQGTANTGFVFMRDNFRTRVLMDTIVNLMPIKTHSDQLLFNMVLRHYKFRQISFAALPNVLFPILADNSGQWQKRGGWPSVITAHVVSSSKEKRLHITGGIFFNSSCPIYDEELWPCGKDPMNCWAGSKPPKKVI